MTDSLYRDHIIQHYKNPHNEGTVDDPDRDAAVSNPNCGDDLYLTASVEDGMIQDIKFEGEGCALSIAAVSLLTDELQGEPVDRITSIDDVEVFELVGLEKDEVSPMRVKCVLLGWKGVQQLTDE